MKRYEKPMVELTKFNAEDIIATSGFSTTEAANAGIVTEAITNKTVKATDNGDYDASGSFLNW